MVPSSGQIHDTNTQKRIPGKEKEESTMNIHPTKSQISSTSEPPSGPRPLCRATEDQRQIRFGVEELQGRFQIPGGQCSSVC